MPRKSEPTPTPAEVRHFYDELTETLMVGYLEKPNQRIEGAIERVLGYTRADTTALEIGCGVGLVTEAIAKVATAGAVWACDISKNAIRHARGRVQVGHVRFLVCDAVHDFDRLKSWVGRSVQLIVMVDVIEHIPLEEHSALMSNLCSLLSGTGTVVLTYPAPELQRERRDRKADDLQLVDEVVELEHVERLAGENGLVIEKYLLLEIWKQHYVHCVLSLPR